MKPENQSPIEVHCTVDISNIEEENGSFICTKCNRKLLNLCEGGDELSRESFSNGKTPCGVYAGVKATVLASALALASCGYGGEVDIGSPYFPRASLVESGDPTRYPEAKWIPSGSNHIVVSPYSDSDWSNWIELNGIPEGSLVNDPRYSIEEKKFFRVPKQPSP